jgi:hypothetical protein
VILADYVGIRRRYARSVNLERDSELADSVKGYVLTPNALQAAERLLTAFHVENSVRAWTLTGVYGTGKSAFAHFLGALCASARKAIRKNASAILGETKGPCVALAADIPESGIVRAFVTAQQEPVTHTIVRALKRGAQGYWGGRKGTKPKALIYINELEARITRGEQIKNEEVLKAIRDLAVASKSGLFIVIDELGKNLEFAAQHQRSHDLYILQRIAELPADKQHVKVFILARVSYLESAAMHNYL